EHGTDGADELDPVGVPKRETVGRKHVVELEPELRTPAHTQHVARRVSARDDMHHATTQAPLRVVGEQRELSHGVPSMAAIWASNIASISASYASTSARSSSLSMQRSMTPASIMLSRSSAERRTLTTAPPSRPAQQPHQQRSSPSWDADPRRCGRSRASTQWRKRRAKRPCAQCDGPWSRPWPWSWHGSWTEPWHGSGSWS